MLYALRIEHRIEHLLSNSFKFVVGFSFDTVVFCILPSLLLANLKFCGSLDTLLMESCFEKASLIQTLDSIQ